MIHINAHTCTQPTADAHVRCPDKLVWEDTVKWVQHIRKSIFHREQLLG